MTDRQLLERFAAGDSSAFEELVRRHAGWIYRVAQRQLRNAALAEDATQAVFLVLVRKAGSLPASTPFAAWLHRVTILTTKEIARKEGRRKQREETAAMMRQEQTSAEENAWMEIAPLLELLVDRLRKSDRQAILLRFYGQRDFADVAAELQTTESAARKRVERAIHKLRQLFAAENIHQSSDLLGSALLVHAGGVADGELISRIAVQTGSSGSTIISRAVLRKLRWMRARLIGSMVGIASVALAAAAVVRSSASSDQPATHAVDPELDRLIAQLQTAETKIHNLRIIHFVVSQQRRFSTIPEWTPTPGRFEGSAWFDDGGAGGRARYQFSKSVEEMTDQKNGNIRWQSQSVDCGSDGLQTRFTAHSDNLVIWPPQKYRISTDPSVEIFPDASGLLTMMESPYRPWSFASAQNAVMITRDSADKRNRARLSEAILLQLTNGTRFHVQQRKINDIQAIGIVAITSKSGDPPQEWWFDPQRGYTLVKSEEFFSGGRDDPKVAWRVSVTKWKEAASGIWFPIAATCEEDRAAHLDRYIYSVDDVIANDPKFDQVDFLPPIAVGERVMDFHSKPPKEYHFSEDSGIP
jgi:RNA polymerase sigma factor (sigma-70 family)